MKTSYICTNDTFQSLLVESCFESKCLILYLDGGQSVAIEDRKLAGSTFLVPAQTKIPQDLKLRLDSLVFTYNMTLDGDIQLDEIYAIKGKMIILKNIFISLKFL